MIYLFFLASLGLNIITVWYIFNMLKLNVSIFENTKSLKEKISFFNQHLSKIYGMETYHGDTTIKMLIDHSKQLTDDLDNFLDSMELEEKDEE